MRDNLPEMLRTAAKEWRDENKVVGVGETRYDVALEEAADAIEELQKRVPKTPHGRLIDAEELKKVIANAKHMDAYIYDGKIRTMYSDHLCVGADYDDVCAAIDETPTIIPAEESEI